MFVDASAYEYFKGSVQESVSKNPYEESEWSLTSSMSTEPNSQGDARKIEK